MKEKNFIVAIELGSSKITGVAGRKNPDGSITILAMVQEKSAGCIRKGTVYNREKAAQCVSNIINELKKKLDSDIAQVYVGIGGQSMRSSCNTIVREFDSEVVISDEIVKEIENDNLAENYGEYEILDTVLQEYKVDARYQMEPVGITCRHLESNYLNILTKSLFSRNLKSCFDSAGVNIAGRIFAPAALADVILTDVEKNIGCAIVDMGYGTTTVSVYYKGLLRHVCVIPLGGNSITRDIASLPVEESTAEALKIRYGSAYTKVKDVPAEDVISLDKDRNVEKKVFLSIVSARVCEIIENVKNNIPDEYINDLAGGIVLTGGCSNMKDIVTAFKNIMGVDKVRIADYVMTNIKSKSVFVARDGSMNTILGILSAGTVNCAELEEEENGLKITPADTVEETPSEQAESVAEVPEQTPEAKKPEPQPVVSEPVVSEPVSEDNQEEETEEEETEPEEPRQGRFKKLFTEVKRFVGGMVSEDPD